MDREQTVEILRGAGARFACSFGCQDRGEGRSDSDADVAACFAEPAPQSFEVLVPPGIDLLVLNRAPLELAGRVSMEGVLLFDDAPDEQFTWLGTIRKVFADERFRLERSRREFADAVKSRGQGPGPPTPARGGGLPRRTVMRCVSSAASECSPPTWRHG